LQELAGEMEDNWQDYSRLVERCNVFKEDLETYQKISTKDFLPESKSKAFDYLKDCFEEIQKFHDEFSEQSGRSWIKKLLLRKEYAKQLTLCHQKLDNCGAAFGYAMMINNETRRQADREKDLEVHFLCLVLLC
jgi:hypothetical protein